MPSEREAGFATAAATIVSLALALIASAGVIAAVTELRLARTDLARERADYALAGAQQEAIAALLTARQEARLKWTQVSASGPISVLAEPQAAKLSLAAAATAGGGAFAHFALADAPHLASRLNALASADASDFQLADADAAPLWRACARSVVSPYGEAKSFTPVKAVAPIAGAVTWRIGETWRVRVSDKDGWFDDRIVRFTGDLAHPAAVVERRLGRTKGGTAACEALFAANAAP